MAKHHELYGLLGQYHVLKHGKIERSVEIERNAFLQFIYECNALEHNRLSREEVENVVRQGIGNVTQDNHEELEVVGLYEGMKYIQRLVTERIDLNEEIIKELHSIFYFGASEDFKGQYRRDYITIPHARNFPPVRHISYYMNKLFEEYKEMDSIDVIERVALFHLKFENIHPFEDGNGQVGRLIINYQLMRAGYPMISIKPEDKKIYTKAFEQYNEELDPTPMVDLIAKAVKDQLKAWIKHLK